MALPTLINNWRFKVNQHLNNLGTTLDCHRQIWLAIKNSLTTSSGWTDSSGTSSTLTSPWVVVASSNGTTALSSDLWLTSSDLNWNNAGAHSWIVLRQTGAHGGNFEICIDLNSSSSIPQYATFVVSWSGFTLSGLSTSSRPTASDERVIYNATDWLQLGVFACALHVMVSDNGSSTRLIVSYSGSVKTAWNFDRLSNPQSGWSVPVVLYMSTAPNYETYNTNANTYFYYNTNKSAYQTTETYGSSILGSRLTVANDLTGEWPLVPIRVVSSSSYPFGVLGDLPDIWFGASTPADGDTYPSTGTLKQFIQVGDHVYPWNQTTPVLS